MLTKLLRLLRQKPRQRFGWSIHYAGCAYCRRYGRSCCLRITRADGAESSFGLWPRLKHHSQYARSRN